jgi:hypothetical protein
LAGHPRLKVSEGLNKMIPKYIKKDCHRFREMISPYIDGRVTQDEKQSLESHLASCHECREELESLRTTVGLLHRLPQVEVPRSFTVVESKPATAPSIFGRLCWASAVAALVLVLLFAGDLFHVYPEKSTGPSKGSAVTIIATPPPNFTVPPDGVGLKGTLPPDITLPNMPNPTPNQEATALDNQTTLSGPVTSESNKATSIEATKKSYRWPVHQVEFAVLGVVVVMLFAVVIVWRKDKRLSSKGG